MGKHHILPAPGLAGGLAGFGLRLWQRTSALDPATELFASGAPASLALWGADGGAGPGGPPAEPGWSPAGAAGACLSLSLLQDI